MIIDKIQEIMKEKGITAYKLEKDTGITQSAFGKWKKGSQPSADKIEILINYLQVDPNTLFEYNMVTESITLTENEKELLEAFRRLPDREQVKEIGRMEDRASKYLPEDGKFINDAG